MWDQGRGNVGDWGHLCPCSKKSYGAHYHNIYSVHSHVVLMCRQCLKLFTVTHSTDPLMQVSQLRSKQLLPTFYKWRNWYKWVKVVFMAVLELQPGLWLKNSNLRWRCSQTLMLEGRGGSWWQPGTNAIVYRSWYVLLYWCTVLANFMPTWYKV